MAQKIFPGGVGNTPYNSFKVFLIAEAYTIAQKAAFLSDCLEFIERLHSVSPFNLTRIRPHWLSIYSIFTPSNSSGSSVNSVASPGRTAFESSFISTSELLVINQSRVNDFINTQTLRVSGVDIPLSEFCVKGDRTYGNTGSLIVLLLPAIAGQPQGGEFENIQGTDDYHYIAVSRDKLWHQVILRGIASSLGLADEFELSGAENLAPDRAAQKQLAFFNIQYFDAVPAGSINARFNWHLLFSANQRRSPPIVHAKVDQSIPDTMLDNPPSTPVGIEFWEGGGGYRTKVWRSAHDCLLRRRVGDITLPLRDGVVPLCPACKHYLTETII